MGTVRRRGTGRHGMRSEKRSGPLPAGSSDASRHVRNRQPLPVARHSGRKRLKWTFTVNGSQCVQMPRTPTLAMWFLAGFRPASGAVTGLDLTDDAPFGGLPANV